MPGEEMIFLTFALPFPFASVVSHTSQCSIRRVTFSGRLLFLGEQNLAQSRPA